MSLININFFDEIPCLDQGLSTEISEFDTVVKTMSLLSLFMTALFTFRIQWSHWILWLFVHYWLSITFDRPWSTLLKVSVRWQRISNYLSYGLRWFRQSSREESRTAQSIRVQSGLFPHCRRTTESSTNQTTCSRDLFASTLLSHSCRQCKSRFFPDDFSTFFFEQRENYLYEELLKLSESISNIHLMRQRYPTTWGSSTLLTAHLQAFKEIFEELKWNFSFILNLSESDFPLK